MHTKLALATVVGAVTAASAICPLNVEISNVNGHQLEVTVTNTGSEDLAVFKGDTVLSGHPTKNLKVSTTAGDAVPFSGWYINYDRRTLQEASIAKIPAGGSTTKTVNVASTHDLARLEQIKIAAVQNFLYQSASSSNSDFSQLSSCSSASTDVEITPDQSTVKRDHISGGIQARSRIEKRGISYSGCSSSRQTTLGQDINYAIAQSKAAITAAQNSAAYYTTWFKSTSVLSTVKSIYTSVSNLSSTNPTVYCTDVGNVCDGSVIAYADPTLKRIIICENGPFYSFPAQSPTCAQKDLDQAGTVLHEASHLYGTDDRAYGESACLALSASEAADNADTYEIYAASVRLGGCSS